MGNSAQIGLLAFCILLSGGDFGSASTPSVPREWEAFRSKFPYQIQGVALSEPRADGARVLILASRHRM